MKIENRTVKKIEEAVTGAEMKRAITEGFTDTKKSIKELALNQIIQGIAIIILAVIAIKR